LSDNLLTAVPLVITRLPSLETLYLHYNQLHELPPEIGQMTQLEALTLNNNLLTELPSEIGQLSDLCYLDLSDNQLQRLPSELGQIDRFTEGVCQLHLFDNPLVSPPPDVVEQGTAAVLEYLQGQES
jgi:Leucine-rich repeat (LRR) protein